MLLSSCNDNPIENNESNPESNPVLLKKVTSSGDNITEYFYDKNLLVKKEVKFEGEIFDSVELTYDGNGILIRKDIFSKASGVPMNYYVTFEYDENNFLAKSNFFAKRTDGKLAIGIYHIYEYKDNLLAKYITFNTSDEMSSYALFKYDNNQNVTLYSHYDKNGKLQYRQEYKYDDKINPLRKDLSFISAFTISRNNIINLTSTYHTVDPPNIYKSSLTYSYNNLGYPLECVSITYSKENGTTSQNSVTSFYEY